MKKTIVQTGQRPFMMPSVSPLMIIFRESDEDSKTLVFIITDGMENASYRYTLKDIKKKIVKLQKDQHWKFIFMGANIDAYGVAGSIGIGKKKERSTIKMMTGE